MCLERFTALRCGHYELHKVDKKNCEYANKTIDARSCPAYLQAIVREDKNRSCGKCKAVTMTGLGVGSFSLMR